MNQNLVSLHEQAIKLAQKFSTLQGELLDVLQKIEDCEGYLEFCSTSLHRYAADVLGLTDDIAYTLTRLARKSKEVPLLKEKIQSREIPISHARTIVSILTPENQDEWLGKAATLSKRELEKEVYAQFPKEETKERIKVINATRLELRMGISEKLETKLRRIQDLLSQKNKKAVSLEETVDALADEFLERHDPIQKAERAQQRKETPVSKQILVPVPENVTNYSRTPIPAHLKHQVVLRDQTQCTHRDSSTQKRCFRRRWLDIHHIVPVSHGGKNELSNLTTLCSAHHRMQHRSIFQTGQSRNSRNISIRNN